MTTPSNIELLSQNVRAQFPILKTSVRGKRLVYLDTAATALKPLCVIEALEDYYRSGTANIHRAVHFLSEQATEKFEATRSKAARFLNAASDEEIVLTYGTTFGINLVAHSWGRTHLSRGDEILISGLEHHANIVPWQMLRDSLGIELKVAPVTDSGDIDLERFEALVTPKTKLVSFSWTSNAIGSVNPILDLTKIAKKHGATVLIDGAQGVAHEPVDVQKIGCDFFMFSSHKIFGATGAGILYGRREILDKMPPFLGGGDMIKSVTFEKSVYADAPARFEAGTPDIAAVIGMGAALDFIKDLGWTSINLLESDLTEYALSQLSSVKELRLLGRPKRRAPIFAFNLADVHPHDVGSILDQDGIAVRTGHHCAQPLMSRFKETATARASFSIYNTREDVDALVRSLNRARELFT